MLTECDKRKIVVLTLLLVPEPPVRYGTPVSNINYVSPDARRQGVFKALLDHVTHEARDHSVVELRLYADTKNQRAHSTYLNQGFTTGHYQVFEKPITKP